MRNSQKSLVVTFAAILGGAAVIMACSGDDDAPSNGGSSSGTSSGSSSSSSSSGSSGTTPEDDGGTQPPAEAGTEAGGKGDKALGETCQDASDCASGVCYSGGTGGGGNASGSFCTIECTMKGQDDDPTCADPALSGKCNGKGFCQKAK